MKQTVFRPQIVSKEVTRAMSDDDTSAGGSNRLIPAFTPNGEKVHLLIEGSVSALLIGTAADPENDVDTETHDVSLCGEITTFDRIENTPILAADEDLFCKHCVKIGNRLRGYRSETDDIATTDSDRRGDAGDE